MYLKQLFNAKPTIFKCSKNNGSPTWVTRLKVSPNMADPISIKDSDSRFEVGLFVLKNGLNPIAAISKDDLVLVNTI